MFRKKKRPYLLIASRAPGIVDAVPEKYPVREAVSTRGAAQALNEVRPILAVVDTNELTETADLPREALERTLAALQEDGLLVVPPADFLTEPERWLGEALLRTGLREGVRLMPPRVVLVTNYVGDLQPYIEERGLRLHLAANKVRTWGEKVAVSDAAVRLAYSERLAQEYAASLADPLLNLLYPGWEQMRGRKNGKGRKNR